MITVNHAGDPPGLAGLIMTWPVITADHAGGQDLRRGRQARPAGVPRLHPGWCRPPGNISEIPAGHLRPGTPGDRPAVTSRSLPAQPQDRARTPYPGPRALPPQGEPGRERDGDAAGDG